MIVLRDSSPLTARCFGAVVALGNFDGLHLGHKAVIEEAVSLAGSAGKPAMVMTFEPHPRRLFRPDLPNLRILPLSGKIRLMREMKVDFVRIVRFTRAFAATSPEDFVTRILHETLRVSHVVTGSDFVFGHNREGNADSLRAMAGRLGFAATACAPVMVEGGRCSSTRIREALGAGDMVQAQKLLGRPYSIMGHVQGGDRRGRELGFPTANIPLPPVFLPAYGIYAVRARVCGKRVKGVANLGIRPDFPLASPLLEVHLFDWRQDIYGERMEVEFVRHIREERKFDGVEALKKQMVDDCKKALSFL